MLQEQSGEAELLSHLIPDKEPQDLVCSGLALLQYFLTVSLFLLLEVVLCLWATGSQCVI